MINCQEDNYKLIWCGCDRTFNQHLKTQTKSCPLCRRALFTVRKQAPKSTFRDLAQLTPFRLATSILVSNSSPPLL